MLYTAAGPATSEFTREAAGWFWAIFLVAGVSATIMLVLAAFVWADRRARYADGFQRRTVLVFIAVLAALIAGGVWSFNSYGERQDRAATHNRAVLEAAYPDLTFSNDDVTCASDVALGSTWDTGCWRADRVVAGQVVDIRYKRVDDQLIIVTGPDNTVVRTDADILRATKTTD